MSSPLSTRPLVFGELLYDHFPDGSRVLGGAPFNVAWHLAGFDRWPLLISRLGRDDAAEEALARMERWGMDLSGMQQDDERPTGRVAVSLSGGEPGYEIGAGQAWDAVEAGPALLAAEGLRSGLLCHGTLALRERASRAALEALRAEIGLPVLVDMNLRDPWWDAETAAACAAGARWVKLNEQELRRLAGPPGAAEPLERLISEHFRAWNLDLLVVTRGAEDGFVHDRQGLRPLGIAPAPRLVDPVGAGDAFTAVLVVGLLEGWPAPRCLARAARFAAEICGRRGATADDRGLYERHRESWEGQRDD